MNIFGYEEEEQEIPSLQKTGMLSTGTVLCITALAFQFITIVLYFAPSVFTGENAYLYNVTLMIITGGLYIGVLAAFRSYLTNFHTQSVNTLFAVIIIYQIVSVLVSAGMMVGNITILRSDTADFTAWYKITSIFRTLLSIIGWILYFVAGAMLLSNKFDFIGGIRAVGGVIIAVNIASIFLFFFNIFGISMLINLMDINYESHNILYRFTGIAGILVDIIAILPFLYVFNKARQYNTIHK